jgi:hypothetical protein
VKNPKKKQPFQEIVVFMNSFNPKLATPPSKAAGMDTDSLPRRPNYLMTVALVAEAETGVQFGIDTPNSFR